MANQFQPLVKIFFIIFLVFSKIILSLQDEACSVPGDAGQSICKRLHRCDYFVSLLRQYNGRQPQNVTDYIKTYKCNTEGLFCCPDEPLPTITTTKTVNEKVSIYKSPEQPTDLNALQIHPNLNLINDHKCGISVSNRVFGGTNAKINEFPWAALLGYLKMSSIQFMCGGNLISPNYVLTVAHCINIDLNLVRLGEHTLSTSPDCDDSGVCADPVQDIEIETTIKYPTFSSKNKIDNIALIKLKTSADLTKNNVQTICLPTSIENELAKVKIFGKPFVYAGWGYQEFDGKPADTLQKGYLKYVENTECARKFTPIAQVHPIQLCAGGHREIGLCRGDSGGGLLTYTTIDGKPKMALYALSASGVGCDGSFPDIFTNVEYYLDWILDNMS